jgi:hypothetical protein
LINSELAAVAHLARQRELKHSRFRNLLAIESGHKLVEFFLAEANDLFAA